MSSVTVITGIERRRRWPVAERMRVLEALSEPGATVAEVARRHDVCTSLIYKWRRDAGPRVATAFVPARLVEQSGNDTSAPAAVDRTRRRSWWSLPMERA